jgi:hypothetical protein
LLGIMLSQQTASQQNWYPSFPSLLTIEDCCSIVPVQNVPICSLCTYSTWCNRLGLSLGTLQIWGVNCHCGYIFRLQSLYHLEYLRRFCQRGWTR